MKTNRVKAKCIVAKSDKLLRDFICNFLKEQELEIVGATEEGVDTIKMLLETQPDLLIAGAELSGISGLDLASWISQQRLKTKTIIFSKVKSPTLVDFYKSKKLDGLLFFDDGTDEFSHCLDLVLKGKSYMSKQVGEICNSASASEHHKYSQLRSLSSTEMKILWKVSLHMSIRQMAESLSVSPNTVNNHLANIRKKLKLNGAHSIVKYALSIKHKLIEVGGTVWIKQEI